MMAWRSGVRRLAYAAALLALIVPFASQAASIEVIRRAWNIFEFRADNSATAPRAVLWTFNDGTTSTEPTVIRHFPRPGEYTVAVEVTDTHGVTTRASALVTVTFFHPGNMLAWIVAGLMVVITAALAVFAVRWRRR